MWDWILDIGYWTLAFFDLDTNEREFHEKE